MISVIVTIMVLWFLLNFGKDLIRLVKKVLYLVEGILDEGIDKHSQHTKADINPYKSIGKDNINANANTYDNAITLKEGVSINGIDNTNTNEPINYNQENHKSLSKKIILYSIYTICGLILFGLGSWLLWEIY